MEKNLCIEAQFSQGSWSRPGIAPRDLSNFLLNFTCTKDKMLYKFIVYLSHNQKTGQRPKRRGPGFPKMLSLALFSENFLLVYLWHLRNPSCRPTSAKYYLPQGPLLTWILNQQLGWGTWLVFAGLPNDVNQSRITISIISLNYLFDFLPFICPIWPGYCFFFVPVMKVR